MRGCLEWLDAARTKAGESLPDRGPRRAPSAPGSYGPGEQKSPPWSAERRPRSRKGTRQDGKTRCAAWCFTPSGLALRGKMKAGAPAPQRIGAAERWLARRSLGGRNFGEGGLFEIRIGNEGGDTLSVVPATAGTHTPCRIRIATRESPASLVLLLSGRQGLWVPAFAGTTDRRYPNFPRSCGAALKS